MQHGIRSDSVLRLERIAALAPPVACVVMLAEWLAYVEWEGLDSARHMNFENVNALVQTELGLPPLSRGNFELQRRQLVDALYGYIQRHMALVGLARKRVIRQHC